MMKAWQRRANKLALDWGVANRRQVEVIRKGFEGWARTSAITGESEPHYPEWRRSVKYVLTGVVMLMQILMMVLIVCALYVGYFLVNSKYTGFPKYALNLGLSTAWGLSLELLNWIVWFKVAVRLTDFENHKTVQQHEDKLIIKIFVFYFIDCFLWFFILAFFQVARNSVHTRAIPIHTCAISHPRRFFQIPFGAWVNDRLADLNLELIPFERPVWMARLGQTIGAVLSITQWSMVLFADAYVPYLVRQWRLRREAKAAGGAGGGGGNGRSGSGGGGGGGAVGSSAVELEMSAARDSPERFPTPDSPQAPRSSSRDSIGGAAMGNGNGSGSGGGGGGGARGGRMRAVLEEGEMTPYDPMLDYSGIVIQFGYVTRLGRLTRSPTSLTPLLPLQVRDDVLRRVAARRARLPRPHDLPAALERAAADAALDAPGAGGDVGDRAVAQPAALRGARVRARQLPDRVGLDRPARLLLVLVALAVARGGRLRAGERADDEPLPHRRRRRAHRPRARLPHRPGRAEHAGQDAAAAPPLPPPTSHTPLLPLPSCRRS